MSDLGAPPQGQRVAAPAVDREIARERSALLSALAEARSAVREASGWKGVGDYTLVVVALGIGVVAGVAVRRFLGR